MAVRIQFRRGTAAEWTSANPTLAAGEAGYETDTAKFKLGNGSTAWNSLAYAGVNQSDIEDAVNAVIDGAPGVLDTLNELAAALNNDEDFSTTIVNALTTHANNTTNVHGIANTALLITQELLTAELNTVNGEIDTHINATTNVHGITNTANLVYQAELASEVATLNTNKAPVESPSFTGTVLLPSTTSIGDVSSTEISYLNNVTGSIQTQLNEKANLDSPEFLGTVVLPSTTSIGNVSSTELSYLDNVTSNIQTQLNGKADENQLDDKADLNSPSFVGTVVLPSTTSIGNVIADEISYLEGVTSSIQDQLDDKADTDSPSFSGTVVLPSTTSIGNVIASEIGHLEGVTSAIQGQLDGKLATSVASTTYAALTGATFTGNVVLTANTTIGTVDSTELGHLNGITSNVQDQLNAKADESDVSNAIALKADAVDPEFTVEYLGLGESITLPQAAQSITSSSVDSPMRDGGFAFFPYDGPGSYTGGITFASGDLVKIDVVGAAVPLPSVMGYTYQVSTDYNSFNASDFTWTVIFDLVDPTAQSISDTNAAIAAWNNTTADIVIYHYGTQSATIATELAYLDGVTSNIQTQLNSKLSLSGGTMTGRVTLSANPTQALHAVTKQYVDGIEAGLKAKPSVRAATTTNLSAIYDNGTDGVGATLTADSNRAFTTLDGVTSWAITSPPMGVLVKNQTNAEENGRYNLTSLGSSTEPWVLTRCGLCDEANEIPGAYVFVQDGTVNEGTGWVQIVADPDTFEVGTDDIIVTQFSGPGSITAGNNISVVGGQVSVVSNPTFANVVTASSGVAFSDGTQTKVGVPSITTIDQKTDSYTLSSLAERDTVIEISSTSATTLTIPAESTVNYPIGTTLDIVQTNTGQVTIAGAGGVTVNATPGLKLRARWSSVTLLKRASNSWLVYGDLTA